MDRPWDETARCNLRICRVADHNRRATRAYAPPQILANTPEQQAVWDDQLNLLEAAFYAPGRIALPAAYGTSLSVGQPCVLIARANKDSWVISVADPTQTLRQIKVTLSGKTQQEVLFELPTGGGAGETVTKTMTR